MTTVKSTTEMFEKILDSLDSLMIPDRDKYYLESVVPK